MNNEQNNNGTSTPSAIVQQTVEQVYEFPRVQEQRERLPIRYGDKQETLRINETTTVTVDAYFFMSATNLKLKRMKTALAGLKKAGVKLPGDIIPEGKPAQKWFNQSVRDPFHKFLRYAARHSLQHGSPVSVGYTKRVNASTGEITVTAKHGFEFIEKLPEAATVAGEAVKQVEDKAKADKEKAKKQSGARARKQGKGKGKKNLQPVLTPENVNRIDALIASNESAKANGTPATEQVAEQK